MSNDKTTPAPLTRKERIREARLRQPAKELLRKKLKAEQRHLRTQEGLDYADSISRKLCRKLTP